jgi:hypothetical protein
MTGLQTFDHFVIQDTFRLQVWGYFHSTEKLPSRKHHGGIRNHRRVAGFGPLLHSIAVCVVRHRRAGIGATPWRQTRNIGGTRMRRRNRRNDLALPRTKHPHIISAFWI